MKSRNDSSVPWRTRRGVGILLLILAMVAGALSSGQLPGTTAGTASDSLGVETPEYPEGQQFDPNKMKDIKAGDPGAGINLIEPPTANNQGQARLGYPIEVPPGRVNLAPSLGLQYNSGAVNGWTGMGWNMSVPTITIDTRWGVPRYDAGLETETYLLNGEQLTPVAHRGELQPRTAEKVFHTRVEGKSAAHLPEPELQ